ncbi:hypothetical protein CEXT_9951 [Caerostris extrusa]|uniref:PCNA-associated factor n=1 Tax=Caerostris extrusa TaxID=172846 RepID=A0AAV4UT59_CAEEX|nr:hypothetical protein CEXT_9951 [Caerostris extrusa]
MARTKADVAKKRIETLDISKLSPLVKNWEKGHMHSIARNCQASCGITGGKAARKIHVLRNETGSTKGGKGKSDKYSGGNPYCPRPTPEWQKPITGFFSKKPNNGNTSEEEKVENSLTFSDEKMESNTSFEESNQNGFLENGVQEEGNSNGSANNSDEEKFQEKNFFRIIRFIEICKEIIKLLKKDKRDAAILYIL